MRWPEARPAEAQPQEMPLEILYEDEVLLVLNKKPGMVVHPAAGHEENTLVNALLHHCAGRLSGIGGVARPGIVHRLDKETSGCLVVAKTDEAHVALSAQFAMRKVEKIYEAIVCGEIPRDAGEIRADILERAPYNVEATFDGRHTVEVRISGSRPVKHAWTGENDLACGPVRTRIYAFDLETEALARVGPRMDVRPWLREWSGISIYRDGFRIWPYGEPHDDWLRLDQRRVNNPVVRLSNNQVVGFVEVSRDRNPELRDQTNREGLLSNAAFDDLRRLPLRTFHAVLVAVPATAAAQREVTCASRRGVSDRPPSRSSEHRYPSCWSGSRPGCPPRSQPRLSACHAAFGLSWIVRRASGDDSSGFSPSWLLLARWARCCRPRSGLSSRASGHS